MVKVKKKKIQLYLSSDSVNDFLSTMQWEEIKKTFLNTSGTMGT